MPKPTHLPATDWPALPARVQGHAGSISIRQPWRVGEDDGQVGEWDSHKRTIAICRSLARPVKWAILAHEFVHSAIDDAGIDLEHELEERLCNAIGSALAAAVERYAAEHRPEGPA